ncbi:MAG: peroxiredoxin [Pseudomonadales bacterium]|nr:peroxiredoxin [Pseudomonadales bacterium]
MVQMLKKGDIAPEFSLKDDAGSEVTLSDLLSSGPLILYFYPADFTPVCTAEACSIRDMHDEIIATDIQIVGVSPQDEASHQRFKAAYNLPFPLLHDAGKTVIRAYGVDGPLGLGVRRATFLIGQDRIVRNRVVSDLFASSHTRFIEQVLSDQQA